MPLKTRLVLSCCLFAFCMSAAAQSIDTVRPGYAKLNPKALQTGVHQYMVIMQRPHSNKTFFFWYWIREVRTGARNGVPVFNITQHWMGQDTSMYREIVSVNAQKDFSPIYHREIVRGKLSAYNWGPAGITSADSVADNSKKDFALNFDAPNFNWNLDMETFEMLPLAEGKTFAINFYDAGLDVPKYVLYKVIGSEVIQTMDLQKVDCWKLFTTSEQNGSTATETFWISKKNHQFLKEEDATPAMYRYKIRMPEGSPNPLEKL